MSERGVVPAPPARSDAREPGGTELPTTTAAGDPYVDNTEINCTRCGAKTVPLHRFCTLCEDCCDCRPFGT